MLETSGKTASQLWPTPTTAVANESTRLWRGQSYEGRLPARRAVKTRNTRPTGS